MTPVRFDFPVITNSDYTEELSFQEGDQYVDLTGHSFRAQIRTAPNAVGVLATLTTVSSPAAEGFFLVSAGYGALQVRITWGTIKALFTAAYPNQLTGDAMSFYYDMLVTLPTGDQEAWLFGYITVTKGITLG